MRPTNAERWHELDLAARAMDDTRWWRPLRYLRARRRLALAHYCVYGPGSAWESWITVRWPL